MFIRPRPAAQGAIEYLIVGLGNPGKEYENTRHNAGFLAIDAIAQKAGAKTDRIRFKGVCGDALIEGKRVLLLKPGTFMNLSGESVREAADYYRIPPKKVIVLFDDISLDVGKMRIRRKGSDGGHNGIKSILYHLRNEEFPRVKIGVGAKPHPDYDLAKWVLSRFTPTEQKDLATVTENCYEVVSLLVGEKTEEAMNRFNQ